METDERLFLFETLHQIDAVSQQERIAIMEKINCVAPMGANPDFRDLIYDLMHGFIDLEEEPVPESMYVENEYVEGKKCERLYGEVYSMKQHLFTRLRSEDDDELEQLVNCLCEIEGIISRKMFDYGWFFAKRDMADKGIGEPMLTAAENE